MKVNDASRIVFGDTRVTLQIVVPLTGDSRGVIYDHNMFILQATSLIFAGKALSLPMLRASERCSTQLASGLAIKFKVSLKCFQGTNTPAYFVRDKEKSFIETVSLPCGLLKGTLPIQALALLSNLKFVLKGFPVTNALAYFVRDKEKSFVAFVLDRKLGS
jgi:hypothetical protein